MSSFAGNHPTSVDLTDLSGLDKIVAVYGVGDDCIVVRTADARDIRITAWRNLATGEYVADFERRSTIKSGIEAGLKQPHAGLQDRNQEREPESGKPRDPTTRQRTWRDGLISAKALQTKTFAPVCIILPGLIPEGVTIVAGKPKIGKSWLALDVCAAIAGDRFVLGETKPVQGDAL